MKCEQARTLVPLYLDGELTTAQSSALRPHLLGCAACRSLAQSEQALSSWFVPPDPVAVPDGFAARVARRAHAGDRGIEFVASPGREEDSGVLLQFVLKSVVLAAGLLMVFSIAMRRSELPETEELRAHESATLSSSLQALEQMNRDEAAEEAREAGEEQ